MTGPSRAEVLATPPRDADTEIRALLQAAETATRCPHCGQPVTITDRGLYPRHQPDQGPWVAKHCPLSRKEAR